MTREEAKRILEFDLDHIHNDESKAALRIAIKALEQEPCDDAISRQAACDAILKYKSITSNPDSYDKAFDDGLYTAMAEIGHNVPSVIPQPKIGKWYIRDTYPQECTCWDCSECQETVFEKSKYCPNCGCRMEGEE